MNLGDRYNMDDTPESAGERECAKSAAYERMIDRADYERDEQRDREMEQREELRELQARTLASQRGPRYFRGVGATDEVQWKFAGGQMFIRDASGGWESSICSVKDLQECLDTVECNEDFEPLEPSDDRGDKLQQAEADDS